MLKLRLKAIRAMKLLQYSSTAILSILLSGDVCPNPRWINSSLQKPGLKIGHLNIRSLQYVAQYPDDTSIGTLKTKTQFLRRPFQLSVNEVFRMKAEHFSF